jgi:hypothetical protein
MVYGNKLPCIKILCVNRPELRLLSGCRAKIFVPSPGLKNLFKRSRYTRPNPKKNMHFKDTVTVPKKIGGPILGIYKCMNMEIGNKAVVVNINIF